MSFPIEILHLFANIKRDEERIQTIFNGMDESQIKQCELMRQLLNNYKNGAPKVVTGITEDWIENNFEKSDEKTTFKMMDLYSSYLKFMKSNHNSIAADTRNVFITKILGVINSTGHGEYVNGKVVKHDGKATKNVIRGWTLAST